MSEPIMKKSQLKLWFLIPFIAFIGGIIMFYFSLGKETDVKINTAINRPVPVFNLPLLTDTSKTMTNDALPAHPYLINVWGSWCPTCIVEHPFLMSLHAQGVDIVGVNYQDELPNALEYLETRGDPFVFSIQDKLGDMAIDLGLTGAPETFVVDAQGNIRQHILGEINDINWAERIEPCLSLLNNLAGTNNDIATYNDNEIAEVCQ